MMNQLHKGYLE